MPPVRNQYFDAWLISVSIDRARKSPNMISSTGRLPVIAAPYAAPVIASSEIGVSNTRSGPYFSYRPGVTANTPPAAATSSPKRNTRSSRASSSSSAWRTASRNSTSTVGSPLASTTGAAVPAAGVGPGDAEVVPSAPPTRIRAMTAPSAAVDPSSTTISSSTPSVSAS